MFKIFVKVYLYKDSEAIFNGPIVYNNFAELLSYVQTAFFCTGYEIESVSVKESANREPSTFSSAFRRVRKTVHEFNLSVNQLHKNGSFGRGGFEEGDYIIFKMRRPSLDHPQRPLVAEDLEQPAQHNPDISPEGTSANPAADPSVCNGVMYI